MHLKYLTLIIVSLSMLFFYSCDSNFIGGQEEVEPEPIVKVLGASLNQPDEANKCTVLVSVYKNSYGDFAGSWQLMFVDGKTIKFNGFVLDGLESELPSYRVLYDVYSDDQIDCSLRVDKLSEPDKNLFINVSVVESKLIQGIYKIVSQSGFSNASIPAEGYTFK